MISCRSDFFQHKQVADEVARQQADALAMENLQRFPLDTIEESEDINNVIREVSEKFHDDLEHHWEAYMSEREPELLESGDGSGFWNYTDGGYRVTGIITLDSMFGSGGYPSNKAFYKKTQEQEKEALKDALESFIGDYEKELIDAKFDPKVPAQLERINYHDLYEAGQGDLAEKLSETESEALGQFYYKFYWQVYYYSPNNRHRQIGGKNPMVQVQAGIEEGYNWMAVDKRFTFKNLSTLKSNLLALEERAIKLMN